MISVANRFLYYGLPGRLYFITVVFIKHNGQL